MKIINSYYFVCEVKPNEFKGLEDEDMTVNDLQLHSINRGFLVNLVLDYQGLDDFVGSVLQVHDN